MKKITVLFLTFLTFILPSCRQEELISVPIFITRFNKLSKEKIDGKDIRAVEDGETLVFSFLLENHFLVTLRTQKDTGRIKQCTVTAQNEKNLSEESFFEICSQVVSSYEKVDKKTVCQQLEDYSFKKDDKSSKNGFFRFDFSINSVAVFFSVENTRISDERITDKKLYEQALN